MFALTVWRARWVKSRWGLWLGVVLLAPGGAGLGAVAAPAPVRGNLGIHDPSTIIRCKDRYYIFGTGDNIISKSSPDRVLWNSGPTVFTNPPAWTQTAVPGFADTFWAPDILYLNGKYCLYYSVSTWGKQVSAIGLVTNPTLDPTDPSYLWTDRGPVIQSTNGSPYNTIDPSICLDATGNPWMSFGSYWNGIYVVQLDPLTGLRIASNSPTYRVAYNSSIEASSLLRRGKYYYLFVNWGSCCAGVNSTYNIRVGRATSITGPYLDRTGTDLASNGGTLFLEGTGKYTGPGHMAFVSEGGRQWFSYHYYDANAWASWYEAHGPAEFDYQPLSWTADDWPVFTNDWSAVYRFEPDARDEHGQFYGLLQGGATIQPDPAHGRVLNLTGTNAYVLLPPGVAYARTFSAVVKWNGGGAWQRIFDFGTDTSRYVMLTPSGNGKLRCDIRVGGNTQTLEAPMSLPTGVWTHVALTLDDSRGILYLNGAAVATNTSMTFSPVEVRAQTNHLGRSKFVADPDFNGQIAAFRVYGRVLSASEIAAPQPQIAQPADGAVYYPGGSIAFSGSAVDFADLPLGSSALNWRIEYVQDGRTNTVLGPINGVAGGTFSIPTNATGGGVYRVLLTATDNSSRQRTVAATVNPANPPAGWSSYYPFKTDARDANSHFDATLHGGASISNDVLRGSVLNLSGNNQFVSLPAGAAGLQTFMAWVKWNGGGDWQRIFDFGNDTTRYCVLTPSADNGKLRLNISVNGIGGELILDGPGPLPVGVWTHVAVTFDGNAAVLYTNGVAVGTNANVNLVPANLGATNLYLGKSQFPDPYLDGQLSAVRLSSRALSAAEIVAPNPVIAQPAHGATYWPGQVIGFNGGAADFYDAAIAPTGLTWTVRFINSGSTNTVLGPLSGTTNGAFTIPASGASATNGYYRITLAATDSRNRRATNTAAIFPISAASAGADWASFYPFTSGAGDASNRYNGTLLGGASIQTDPQRGNVLNLSGNLQYVSLPAGAATCQTFGGWVKWNGGGAWQRVFDLGQNNNDWVMLTPRDSSGRMQAAITADRAKYVRVVQAPVPLPTNSWIHLALVFDGRQAILYTNGVPLAVNHSVNLLPADLRATKAYIGRSQYSADPYFNGRLDSIRLNSIGLSPDEFLAPWPVIVQPLANSLYSGGQFISYWGSATDYADAPLPPAAFTWSAEFYHDNETEPVFGPQTGATNGSFQIASTGPTTTNAFYRLKLQVTDAGGRQASVSRDLLPRISRLNFDTVPPGLQVSLDGGSLPTPASLPAVAGLVRTLSVPSPQDYSGSNYNFVLWSDGGARTHSITTPIFDSHYTASFVWPSLGVGVAGTNAILNWPDWASYLSLYGTTNLSPPVAWAPVTNNGVVSNGWKSVVVPTTAPRSLFRLYSP